MTPRTQAAIEAVEAVRAEPFGDRRVRLYTRARRVIRELLFVPYDPAAPLYRDPRNPETSDAERFALEALDRELLFHVDIPDRPMICVSGSQHKAERIAKRETKRNLRRWQRRRGNDATREVVDAER